MRTGNVNKNFHAKASWKLKCALRIMLFMKLGPSARARALGRRLLVFLLGGLICDACGHGHVGLGGFHNGIAPLVCQGCCRLFGPKVKTTSLRKQWKMVWRPISPRHATTKGPPDA